MGIYGSSVHHKLRLDTNRHADTQYVCCKALFLTDFLLTVPVQSIVDTAAPQWEPLFISDVHTHQYKVGLDKSEIRTCPHAHMPAESYKLNHFDIPRSTT